MRLRRIALLALVPAALAVGTSSADASIVPATSIAGATLGQTAAQINARFGQDPSESSPDDGNFVVYAFDRIDGYGYFDLPAACAEDDGGRDVNCDDGPATYLVTKSKRQRTAQHIGPGVREATARRRLKGERCESYYVDDLQGDGVICTVKAPTGRASTDYTFYRGRVFEVAVSK